jgi:two-component system cell cycle response regulator DivK
VYQILVIDDDPTGTQLLIDLLRFAGHQGFPLENWQDPVADIVQKRPDLVIMDVRLKVYDGLDLLCRLRAHSDLQVRSTPVLMISAEDSSARCRAVGANGFVEKPFDTESLFRAVQEILEVSVSGD